MREKSPAGKEVQYQWGGAGCASCGDGSKLSKIIDASGLPRGDSITRCLAKPRHSDANTWEFKYDVMGNPLEMIYPDGSKITQEYDIAGSPKGIASLDASRSLGIVMLTLSKFTNKRGQEITYAYDADGKLTGKVTPEGTIAFTYDVRDRISEIEGNDFHYQYGYGNCSGISTLYNSLVVREKEINSGRWTEQLIGYHDLPWQNFDSFGWNKVFRYNFTTTPVGYTPISVTYHKRYLSALSSNGR